MAEWDMIYLERCGQEKKRKDWPIGMEEDEKEGHMEGLLRLLRV